MQEPNPTGKERKHSWWNALLRSPLARTLVAGFLIIATVEAAFMAVLCMDVDRANRSAAYEFELLRGSQQMSHAIKSAQKVIDAGDLARKNRGNAILKSDYERVYGGTIEEMNRLIDNFGKIGLDKDGATRLRDSFGQFNEIMKKVVFDTDLPVDGKLAFKTLINTSKDLYDQFLDEIKSVHQALKTRSSKTQTPVAGLEPQQLLFCAALVNVLMLLVMVVLVERGITSPIARLTSACERIRKGEPIARALRAANEIGSLEQSFYEMSLAVSENEKRRHCFLEFFQSVQSAALEKVRVCFDALLTEKNLGERAVRNIRKAKANLGILVSLLQSMTEALRFNSGSEITPEYSTVGSACLLASACEAVEALVQKRQINLKVEDENYPCSLDKQLIVRVLINFLSNAIKYSPDSGAVILRVDEKDGLLHFSVSDKGPGISFEDQKKLFKEFSQLVASDGVKRSGTGLGLVICKQIVEAHGGRVGVESEPGKGSCFWFEIPSEQVNKAVKAAPDRRKIQAKESETKTSSLKRTFVIMLLFLVIPQSLIFWRLHAMFGDASRRAASFYAEKEVLMGSEELLGMYLTWKLDVARAIDSMQFENLAKTGTKLGAILQQCKLILSHAPAESQGQKEIKKIASGMKRLKKFTDYASSHKENVSFAVMPELVAKARQLAKDTERSIFSMMTIEDSSIQYSYDWSLIQRQDLLSALLQAAVVNSLLLASLCVVGLRITERIADLKHKAEDFAGGKRLEPTLTGSDELRFLDSRLCEVSQAIKDADLQRQKLIAVINHDLRTPLSSILNGLQMIMASGYGEIGEKEKTLTTAAEQELSSLLQQINDLLLIEKIDAGLYQLTPERFQVFPVLEAAVRSFSQSAAARGVRLVPDATAECQDLCMNGDRSLVERQFAIIISNAVKAAPEGSTIDVLLSQTGRAISVSFRDSGGGISEELLPHIFERFRFVGGKPVTGLGLPLAQRLSVIHGGSLEINSTPAGTETKVCLPIAV